MSSFKKAQKSRQKTHRERSQPSVRAHLGLLEKKKDYQRRARDYNEKQSILRGLRRKAQDKNPNEFYFNMVRSKLEDGEHKQMLNPQSYTKKQILEFNTQDRNYVNYRRSIDLQKIEKLKASLHLVETGKTVNKHTVFTDSRKQAKEFEPAMYFDTDPQLLSRKSNRVRRSTLATTNFDATDEELAVMTQERRKKYKELVQRIEREKKLRVLQQKLELKAKLMDETKKKKKISDETPNAPAVYRWVPQRQK